MCVCKIPASDRFGRSRPGCGNWLGLLGMLPLRGWCRIRWLFLFVGGWVGRGGNFERELDDDDDDDDRGKMVGGSVRIAVTAGSFGNARGNCLGVWGIGCSMVRFVRVDE